MDSLSYFINVILIIIFSLIIWRSHFPKPPRCFPAVWQWRPFNSKRFGKFVPKPKGCSFLTPKKVSSWNQNHHLNHHCSLLNHGWRPRPTASCFTCYRPVTQRGGSMSPSGLAVDRFRHSFRHISSQLKQTKNITQLVAFSKYLKIIRFI